MDDAKIMLTAVYDRLALSIETGPSEADLADLALLFRGVDKRLGSVADMESRSQHTATDEIIPVTTAGTTKMVPRSSVRWVEAQGDYARLHTTEGSYLLRVPLAQLEARWANAGFLRIHRSFIVLLSSIAEVRTTTSGYLVRVGTGAHAPTLPVSRRYGRRLKDRLRAVWRPGPGVDRHR